jgi:thiol-disulfide isomerase/thioredoxin
MKLIRLVLWISILGLCLFSAGVTAVGSPLPEDVWLRDAPGYARALELQRHMKVPLVVYFYADWCPYCRSLDTQYLPSAPAQLYLKGVIKVRINPEHGSPEREIASRYKVTGYPAFFILGKVGSAPLDVNPFRRGGDNLTPLQFINACRRAALVSARTRSPVSLNKPEGIKVGLSTTETPAKPLVIPPGTEPPLPPVERSVPTLDQILTRYEQVIGGKEAMMRLSTRVTKGKVDVAGVSFGGRMEVYSKAPNRTLTVMDAEPIGLLKRAFDGRSGWSQDRGGLQSVSGDELTTLAADADFYREIKLRELYPRMRLIGRVEEGYRELYKVEAASRTGNTETLYFDVSTGLLTRREVTRRGANGLVRAQFFFSDWRDVDGVKIPFKVTESLPTSVYIFTLEDVKHNVPVDDQIFRRPS